jgi:hypothetical protein
VYKTLRKWGKIVKENRIEIMETEDIDGSLYSAGIDSVWDDDLFAEDTPLEKLSAEVEKLDETIRRIRVLLKEVHEGISDEIIERAVRDREFLGSLLKIEKISHKYGV